MKDYMHISSSMAGLGDLFSQQIELTEGHISRFLHLVRFPSALTKPFSYPSSTSSPI